jgi:adenylate kinase family enzyme
MRNETDVAHKRILIIGCSGSGKSTLALRIGQKLDLPVIHLDRIFWRDNWQSVTMEEFDSLLAMELKKDRWVMDGNYTRTISERLKWCDSIIYLDFPRFKCIRVAIGRVIRHYGKTRPDVGGNCPERFDLDFLKYIWNFNKNHRERYLMMLKELKHQDIYIMHNRRECIDLLNKL